MSKTSRLGQKIDKRIEDITRVKLSKEDKLEKANIAETGRYEVLKSEFVPKMLNHKIVWYKTS